MANTITVDQILTTSMYKYASTEFNDQIFEGLKAMKVLMSRPDFKQIYDGGDFLVVPVDLAMNPTPAFIGEWDEIPLANKDTGLMAQFQWKILAASVDFSRLELAKNNGAAAVIKLVLHKINNAKSSMQTQWATSLFSDGTGFGGNEFAGLEAIIAATGVLGQIDRATYPAWAANVDSTGGTLAIPLMEHMYNTASHNIESPDLIITSQFQYERYSDAARAALRFQSNDEANLGFENTKFKGATMIWDKYCPADKMYFVNTKQLELGVHADNDFEVLPAERMVRQFAYTQPISWFGALYPLQCRMHGKLTGLSTS